MRKRRTNICFIDTKKLLFPSYTSENIPENSCFLLGYFKGFFLITPSNTKVLLIKAHTDCYF